MVIIFFIIIGLLFFIDFITAGVSIPITGIIAWIVAIPTFLPALFIGLAPITMFIPLGKQIIWKNKYFQRTEKFYPFPWIRIKYFQPTKKF